MKDRIAENVAARGFSWKPSSQSYNNRGHSTIEISRPAGLAWVTLKVSVQDEEIYLTGILSGKALAHLDDLRAGQKVTVEGTLLTTNLDLMIDDILPETRMLTCGNGHNYAPSSGYKFCPVDGLELN